MAEYKYLQYPYYLHHNLGHYIDNFDYGLENTDKLGLQFLKDSIDYQRGRESRVFEALGLSRDEWQKIGTIIYGVFEPNDDEKVIISNKFELFLKSFIKFLNDEVLAGTRITGLKGNKASDFVDSKEISKGLKNFEKLTNRFIDFYNEPIEQFTQWYNKSDFKKEGELNPEELNFLNMIFDNYRAKRKTINNSNGKWKSFTEIGLQEAEKLMDASGGMLSNLIGAIGEQATISFRVNGKKYISKFLGTSDWTQNEDEEGGGVKYKDLLDGNEEFYLNVQKDINSELEERKIKLASKDGNLNFGWTFNTKKKNTNTLRKNLKADELFELQIDANLARPIRYGISSKTSWTEGSDSIKIYTGSFLSAFENIFKSFGGEQNFSSVADTAEVINFLQYSTFNSLGVAYYGSIKKDEKDNVDMSNVYNNYRKVQELYNRVVNYYSFQWFTGGISKETHADFFSLYSNEKHYFIPMSIILEKIYGLTQAKINNDNKIELFLSQSLFPSNKPIAEDKYNSTRDYGKMMTLGAKTLEREGAVTFKKEKLKELYHTGIL